MKANELMIGDWVQIPEPIFLDTKIPVRVVLIREDDYIEINDGTGAFGYELSRDGVEPVPLTQEIVYKNADNEYPSEYTTSCRIVYLGKYPNSIEITVYSSGEIEWTINECEYTILALKYVHELQHALRLAGIEKEIIL